MITNCTKLCCHLTIIEIASRVDNNNTVSNCFLVNINGLGEEDKVVDHESVEIVSLCFSTVDSDGQLSHSGSQNAESHVFEQFPSHNVLQTEILKDDAAEETCQIERIENVHLKVDKIVMESRAVEEFSYHEISCCEEVEEQLEWDKSPKVLDVNNEFLESKKTLIENQCMECLSSSDCLCTEDISKEVIENCQICDINDEFLMSDQILTESHASENLLSHEISQSEGLEEQVFQENRLIHEAENHLCSAELGLLQSFADETLGSQVISQCDDLEEEVSVDEKCFVGEIDADFVQPDSSVIGTHVAETVTMHEVSVVEDMKDLPEDIEKAGPVIEVNSDLLMAGKLILEWYTPELYPCHEISATDTSDAQSAMIKFCSYREVENSLLKADESFMPSFSSEEFPHEEIVNVDKLEVEIAEEVCQIQETPDIWGEGGEHLGSTLRTSDAATVLSSDDGSLLYDLEGKSAEECLKMQQSLAVEECDIINEDKQEMTNVQVDGLLSILNSHTSRQMDVSEGESLLAHVEGIYRHAAQSACCKRHHSSAVQNGI